MKYLLFISLLVCTACNSTNQQFAKAENALDAGREFIDALLKGNIEKASFYMLQDEKNVALLKQYQKKYSQQNKEEQTQLQQSVINILQVEDVSENETIINYSNSFDKIAHKIKVVKKNSDWLVDFTSTFDGNL